MKWFRLPLATSLFALTALGFVLLGCTPSEPGKPTSPGAGTGSNAADPSSGGSVTLLNVSYDPTREFYSEFNGVFAEYWKQTSGQTLEVQQSHGGSGKQARAVIDGLEADVVTLALAYDTNAIVRKANLISEDWQKRMPHNSSPYTSTIVFLVRKGNPKNIKDWDDLARDDIQIITPNPKTSGGARWNYLAGWGYILKKELGDFKKLSDPASAQEVEAANAKAQAYIAKFFKNVAVLDSGARGSTNTFAQREIGDVLVTWENDAFLAVKENEKQGKASLEIITPSVSILAEPAVSVVDKVVDKRGTRAVAEAYLQYLYSPVGQKLAAKHYYRPAVEGMLSDEELSKFVKVDLFTIDEVFGGWDKAQAAHFDDGGLFDKIYQPGK